MRLRSTSNTPRNDSARVCPVWAPYDYDLVTGIGSAGSSADEEDNSEPTDLETRSTVAKPLKGSPQNPPNDSDVEKSLRGYGSASLLKALRLRRTQLGVPAACASQGAMGNLRSGQFPQQVMSTRSGLTFPQSS